MKHSALTSLHLLQGLVDLIHLVLAEVAAAVTVVGLNLIDGQFYQRIVRVRVTEAVPADPPHDPFVGGPVLRPGDHVVPRWVVDTADLSLALGLAVNPKWCLTQWSPEDRISYMYEYVLERFWWAQLHARFLASFAASFMTSMTSALSWAMLSLYEITMLSAGHLFGSTTAPGVHPFLTTSTTLSTT